MQYKTIILELMTRIKKLEDDYLRGCGHMVDSIEAICDDYEQRLR